MANKIKDSNITPGTIAADKLAGGITNSQLAGSVAADKLAGSIPNSKLSNSAITINGTSIALGASGNIVAGTDWQAVKTADFTAVAGEGYFINTTSSAVTVTLPASPSQGDEISIRDYLNTFNSNNVTLNRNGNNINGVAGNGSLSINGAVVHIVYSDATRGWLVLENEAKSNILTPEYVAATGGTVTSTGDFKIHVFNSSSNFVVSNIGNATGNNEYNVLVVAGGGSGGGGLGGGGGGGGARHLTGQTFPATATIPITVGAGGSAHPSTADSPAGSSSVFSTITSAGGGGGGRTASGPNPGKAGGSGGGGSGQSAGTGGSGNTPPVSPPQGASGGAGKPNGALTAGGGGGGGPAGQAGIAGTAPSSAGTGGAGTQFAPSFPGITFGSPAPTGQVSGGGGGGQDGNGNQGGAGGGAAAGNFPAGTANNASANTGGGGGGGAGGGPSGGPGGAGGSGLVIVRYKYQN